MKTTTMKTTSVVLGVVLMLAITLVSCGNASKQAGSNDEHDHSEMAGSEAHAAGKPVSMLIDSYLKVKNSLVNDNAKGAAAGGEEIAKASASFDATAYPASEQPAIQEMLQVMKEHGEHIAKSEIDHQREHFELLSKDMADLLAIVGTDRTLYQQYCPMYNNNKGGSWLSDSEEVKNPLFGSQMLTCGSVTQTIAKD